MKGFMMVFNDLKLSTALMVNCTLGVVVLSSIFIYNAAIENGVVLFDRAAEEVDVNVGALATSAEDQPFEGYAKKDFANLNDGLTSEPAVVGILQPPEPVAVELVDEVKPVDLHFASSMPDDLVPFNFAKTFSFPGVGVKNPDFTGPEVELASLSPAELIEAPLFPASEDEQIVVSGVIDFLSSDTGTVGDTLVTFEGVHGPSSSDTCETSSGKAYDCGNWSLAGMRTIVAEREVTCSLLARKDLDTGAQYANCTLVLRNGEEHNLAEIGLKSGILVLSGEDASKSSFMDAEQTAREAGNGVWSGVYVNANNKKEQS
jgi:endonuclease YncB( thermonuclease family)